MCQVEVSHKSEMAGPFNRGDTIINKHFTLLYLYQTLCVFSQTKDKKYIEHSVAGVLPKGWDLEVLGG